MTHDRRTPASRFFRWSLKHSKLGAWLLACGWSLAALGQAQAPHEHGDDPALRVVTILIGLMIALFGMIAGISKWVAEPAARKVFAEHLNSGDRAHLEYLTRREWDEKHEDLKAQVATLSGDIRSLTAELRRRSGEHVRG